MRGSGVFEEYNREVAVKALEATWGFAPAVFDVFRFWRRLDSTALWIAAKRCEPPADGSAESIGILLTREFDRADRLSTHAIRLFGHAATKWVVTLDEAQSLAYLQGEDLDGLVDVEERGLRIVTGPLGSLGRARADAGVLRCELPKPFRVPQPTERATP